MSKKILKQHKFNLYIILFNIWLLHGYSDNIYLSCIPKTGDKISQKYHKIAIVQVAK
jgi:hypothetical protein